MQRNWIFHHCWWEFKMVQTFCKGICKFLFLLIDFWDNYTLTRSCKEYREIPCTFYPVSSVATICRIMVKCQFYNFYLVLLYRYTYIHTHSVSLQRSYNFYFRKTIMQYDFPDVEIDSQDTESFDTRIPHVFLLQPQSSLLLLLPDPFLSLHVTRISYKMNSQVCIFDIGVFSQHIFL